MARPTPRAFGSGFFFGVPVGDLGWFTSLLMSFATGFASFFAATFCGIVSILIYNGATHGNLDYSLSYRRIGFPFGVLMLVVALSYLGTLWVKPSAAQGLGCMEESRPSRTALSVALRRAAHQIFDAPPLVLNDPLAIPILGPHADELRRTPKPSADQKQRPHSIGLRAFLVARSRYAEDLLAAAVARGITQYVLLGAGLDTFAHRNPHPMLRVFEIDHPATQQWKRELLASSHLPAPSRLTYVPVDFERQSLAGQLASAGHDAAQPTFFAWLGVVPYLTLAAFRSTLAYIAEQPAGSGLIFDYGQPRSALSPNEQLARDSMASRVQSAGEPFQLFFPPAEVASELAAFHTLEDLGATELNARYFANRTDALKLLGSGGRMVSAWR